MTRIRRQQTARRRRESERGQIIVVFAVGLVTVLAMAGLLIDGGLALGNRRQGQTAADGAALAAVRAYAAEPAGTLRAVRLVKASQAATDLARMNGFPSGSVTCPGQPSVQGVDFHPTPTSGNHIGDPLYIEVIVTKALGTTFSRVIPGQDCWLVSARAVAQLVEDITPATGTPFPAVLAGYGPDPCSDKAFANSGGDFTIVGSIVSNSGVGDTGGGGGMTVDGTVSYVANPPNTCGTAQTSKAGPASCATTPPCGWTGAPTTTTTPFPVTYTFDTTTNTVINNTTGQSHACDWMPPSAGNWNLGNGPWWVGGTTASDQLMPGVYCNSTGDIGLANGGTVGNVTFVATGKVTSSAGGVDLTAYWDGLLALSLKGGATTTVINFSGSGSHWEGILYAPIGQVRVSGGGGITQRAALWGQTVITTGSGWTLDSTNLGSTGAPAVITYRPGTLVE